MTVMETIAALLAERPPEILDNGSRTRAAVALVLLETGMSPEILFIVRACHERDPWSGDIGLPGGKVESAERDAPRLAAERETLEEVGLDLKTADYLGRLDDLTGAHLPIIISCFVYGIGSRPHLRPNHEIADTFWVPLADLTDPGRHHTATVRFGGATLERPAIRLLEPGRTVLWGITYRLIRQLLQRLCPGLSPDGEPAP